MKGRLGVESSPESLVLVIEKVVAGGLGLGSSEGGGKVLVPAVLPGEKVRVRVRRARRDYLECRLLELLTPSPHRCLPPCPWYGSCGGCDLQHADYPTQLAVKQQILEDLLKRHSLDREVLPVLAPPAASAEEFHYRNRVRLHLVDGRAGFFRPLSHDLQEVDSCLLARPELNQMLARLTQHQAWPQLAARGSGFELSLDQVDGRVVLMLNLLRRPAPAQLQAAGRLCRDLPRLKGVGFLPQGHVAGPYLDLDSLPAGRRDPEALLLHLSLPSTPASPSESAGKTLDLAFEPTGFSQVNQGQNLFLLERIKELLQPKGDELLADLHCGMGNFSLPLAPLVKEVHGVDLQAAAIRSARTNAVGNEIKNCHFYKASALDGLNQLIAAGINSDILLLDPPRTGCRDLVRALSPPYPSRIIMISCDPATMLRDLVTLRRHGYGVAFMQMVDMFPQTHHLETITLMRSQGAAGCGKQIGAAYSRI